MFLSPEVSLAQRKFLGSSVLTFLDLGDYLHVEESPCARPPRRPHHFIRLILRRFHSQRYCIPAVWVARDPQAPANDQGSDWQALEARVCSGPRPGSL